MLAFGKSVGFKLFCFPDDNQIKKPLLNEASEPEPSPLGSLEEGRLFRVDSIEEEKYEAELIENKSEVVDKTLIYAVREAQFIRLSGISFALSTIAITHVLPDMGQYSYIEPSIHLVHPITSFLVTGVIGTVFTIAQSFFAPIAEADSKMLLETKYTQQKNNPYLVGFFVPYAVSLASIILPANKVNIVDFNQSGGYFLISTLACSGTYLLQQCMSKIADITR